jgi:hypothetical protein
MAASTDNSSPPCALCGAAIVGYGHNAAPMAQGKCCDTCNLRVMAVRIRGHLNSTMEQVSPEAMPELEEKFCAICQTRTY